MKVKEICTPPLLTCLFSLWSLPVMDVKDFSSETTGIIHMLLQGSTVVLLCSIREGNVDSGKAFPISPKAIKFVDHCSRRVQRRGIGILDG